MVHGRVMSSALFNFYLADFQIPPPNIKLIKYADDIAICTSGPVVADIINSLNIYLSQVLNYISNKKLTASTAKSAVTLFMPDTHEHHLHPQEKLDDRSTTAQKEFKSVRSDVRHPFHFHTTLQQYCSKSAATQ